MLFKIDKRRAETLAKYLMASCHTPAMRTAAKARGWRTFTVVVDERFAAGDLACPYYSHGVQCEQCQLCNGSTSGARDIYVPSHAKVGQNLSKVQ